MECLCGYLYFTASGEKIYIKEVREPNKINRFGNLTISYKIYYIRKIINMLIQLDNTNAVPLYQQLSSAIHESIEQGEYGINSQIPTEYELGKKYGVSRVTVRKAIGELVEDGVLVRSQGKGTFVATKNPVQNLYPFISFALSCEAVGRIPTTTLISYTRETPTRKQREFFGISQSSKIIVIKRIRSVDGVPAILETNLFPPCYDFFTKESLESLNKILNKHGLRPTHSDGKISICRATQEESEYLQVEEGTPLLYVYGQAKSQDGKPLEISKQIIRTDNYQYLVQF